MICCRICLSDDSRYNRHTELGEMVKKIIGYEAKRQPGSWQGRLMQVVDNEVDNVGDDIFERASKQLIEGHIPVGYDTRKVYLRQIGSPERTKQAILATIDEGVLVVEYSGHGGTQTWADEGIFRIADAEDLGNVHLPFIVTTTCLNGQFDQPLQFGQRSLSEQFLMGSTGAIGVLSATRLTYATVNAEFDKNLFTSIFTVRPSTLGAIIADAKTPIYDDCATTVDPRRNAVYPLWRSSDAPRCARTGDFRSS